MFVSALRFRSDLPLDHENMDTYALLAPGAGVISPLPAWVFVATLFFGEGPALIFRHPRCSVLQRSRCQRISLRIPSRLATLFEHLT